MNLRNALLVCATLHTGLSETDSQYLERAADMASKSPSVDVTDTFCDGIEKMSTLWPSERAAAVGNLLADMVVAENYGCNGVPA